MIRIPIRSISIETMDYCNRKCDWCPNKHRDQTPENSINDRLFTKVLRDIKKLGYMGELHPYFRNEPLCDPKILARIREMRAFFPTNRIRLNTNGDFLKTTGDVENLIKAGVSSIHVMHYDEDGDGKKRDIQYPNVTHWFGKTLFDTFDNKAGSVEWECVDKRVRCPFIGEKIMITYDGDMVTCCADFMKFNVFGNLWDMSLLEILQSQKFLEFYYAHQTGKGKTLTPCNQCNRI